MDCTGPVLRESACKSAAEVVGRPVLSADTESDQFVLYIEARGVWKVPDSVSAAVEDVRSDREPAEPLIFA